MMRMGNHRSRPAVRGVAAAVAFIGLLACGGGGGGGGDGGGSESQAPTDSSRCPADALEAATAPVPVTVWHGMTAANGETLSALTDEYNASQRKVKVQLVFQGNYDETSDKYLTALRGGELPGIVQLEETRLQLMIDSGSVVPAQTCVDAAGYDLSDHLAQVVAQATVDGVLWPMPFNVSTPVLFYNRKAFEAAGLDPDAPPATFDELRAAAQKVVDSRVAEYGFAIGLAPDFIEQWFAKANVAFTDHDNGRTGRATHVAYDAPIALQIYTFLAGLVQDGLAVNTGRQAAGPNHLLSVGSGQSAMTIASSAVLGSVFDILGQGQFPAVGVEGAAVAPMPGPTGGGVLPGGGSLYLVGKDKSPEEVAAAFDYARFLNEPETQARWHAGTGYLPIRTSALDLPEVATLWAARPAYRVAYDQLLASAATLGGPVIGAYGQVRDIELASLERVLLEGQDPAAAVAAAQRDADAAIAAYNDSVGG